MTAGSGRRANPWDAAELSNEGLSLKVKSAPSRAPAASIMAASISGAVWEKSRSAVSSGPRSVSVSTVRNSRRKLFFWTANGRADKKPEHEKSTMHKKRRGEPLLVSLVPKVRNWPVPKKSFTTKDTKNAPRVLKKSD